MQSLHDALDVIIALPWLSTLLIALLGLCVGSFLNVVIYRLPRIMESEWRQDCSVLLHDELQEQHRLDDSKPQQNDTESTCFHVSILRS